MGRKNANNLSESIRLYNRLCPYCGDPVNALDPDDQIASGVKYDFHCHGRCFDRVLHDDNLYNPIWQDWELLKFCEPGKMVYDRESYQEWVRRKREK